MGNIVWPSVLTGVGLAMIFVPLAAVAMGTLPQAEIGNASGIFNLMRNVGGSVGISLSKPSFSARRRPTRQTWSRTSPRKTPTTSSDCRSCSTT